MKMTVKEFVKLDLTSLMQVNGGTSACGNYTQTQPATPPSGGNETNNAPSNNGGGTSGNNTTSYSPTYSGGSTTGTSTGTCGGSGDQNKNPGGDNPSNDKPNNDTTNNNNNNNGGGGFPYSTGTCGGKVRPVSGDWGDVDSGSRMQDELDAAKVKEKNGEEVNKVTDDNNTYYENDIMNGNTYNSKKDKFEQNLYSTDGCKMEGASQIATEILGSEVSITTVNNDYDKDKNGLLSQDEISAGIRASLPEGKTLTTNCYSADNKNVDVLSVVNLQTVEAIAGNTSGTTYVLGRAEDVAGGQHWVVLEGYSINDRGQIEFEYNPTSKNDEYNNRTYVIGDIDSDQKNVYKISKIETYTIIDTAVGL